MTKDEIIEIVKLLVSEGYKFAMYVLFKDRIDTIEFTDDNHLKSVKMISMQ